MSPDLIQHCQRAFLLAGRGLLGLYFIVPGITKITGFAAMTEYMAEHNVPMVSVLLVLNYYYSNWRRRVFSNRLSNSTDGVCFGGHYFGD